MKDTSTPRSTMALRHKFGIPITAHVHIPDDYKLDGYRRRTPDHFEFDPVYTNGTRTLSEPELLLAGIARFRVTIDRTTVRDFTITSN